MAPNFPLPFPINYILYVQGIWPDAERTCKLRGNLRAYYAEDSVNYVVKIANYTVVLEQTTYRKNRSITRNK